MTIVFGVLCFIAGINVGCLMAIFSQLNIDGVKPWNEMSNEEREYLINGRFLR